MTFLPQARLWTGLGRNLTAAKVLVADLTSRNPNVLMSWDCSCLEKAGRLISSNEDDIPFDVRHIRVIYYDTNDPFWGDKLIAKSGGEHPFSNQNQTRQF